MATNLQIVNKEWVIKRIEHKKVAGINKENYLSNKCTLPFNTRGTIPAKRISLTIHT